MKRTISVVLCFVLIALSANGLFVSADNLASTTAQTEESMPVGEIYLEETATDETTVAEAATAESTMEETTTEESTTAEAATEETAMAETITEESTTEEFSATETTTEEVITEESVTEESTTAEAATAESTTVEYTTEESTTEESTSPEIIEGDIGFAENLEDITMPAQDNGDVSTLASSEFWIKDTAGDKVVQRMVKPSQSYTFKIHENYLLYSASNVTWSASPNRGTLSTTKGDTCVFTAGTACGTTTLTATLASGITYSVKIYIVKSLEIIRPTTYNKITYEHIYVGASKEVRGNTVDNTEYNSDILVYWTTEQNPKLSYAWTDSRKCWTTQTITGVTEGDLTLHMKVTTQAETYNTEIPVTVITPMSPNKLGFVKGSPYLRIQKPTVLSTTRAFNGAAVTIKGSVGDFYYVTFGSTWGFLPKSSVEVAGNNQTDYGAPSGMSPDYYSETKGELLGVTSFKNGFTGNPNVYQSAVNEFINIYNTHKNVEYKQISDATDIPVILIAALHFRESTGDFDKTIANGDDDLPAGKTFVEDAISVINAAKTYTEFKEDIGLTKDSRNLLAMLQYAEYWNGVGCKKYNHGINPYLYAGTNIYTSGKYVSDGSWNSSTVDEQPGVLYLLSQFY